MLLVVCRPLPPSHLIFTGHPLSVLQMGWCVSLHLLGGAEHKTTTFPNPCQECLHYLFSYSFSLEGAGHRTEGLCYLCCSFFSTICLVLSSCFFKRWICFCNAAILLNPALTLVTCDPFYEAQQRESSLHNFNLQRKTSTWKRLTLY
jgi:hypothetical protein